MPCVYTGRMPPGLATAGRTSLSPRTPAPAILGREQPPMLCQCTGMSVRKAQSNTGKHSTREWEATPPARPWTPDGQPGAFQVHHQRLGGSEAKAQCHHLARAVCCVRGTPASVKRARSVRICTPVTTHDTPGAGRCEGAAGRVRSVPFTMNVRPSSGVA